MRNCLFILTILASFIVVSSVLADMTNFAQAFPGISQAALESDLEHINANPAFTPTNLQALMNSNYFNSLPAGHPWLFDNNTQTGISSGMLTATGQVVSAPAVPVRITQAQALNGKFSFAFLTVSNFNYNVYCSTGFTPDGWNNISNFTGDGYFKTVILTATNAINFYRISEPSQSFGP